MATEEAQPEQPLSLASPTRDNIHNDDIHINKLFFKGSGRFCFIFHFGLNSMCSFGWKNPTRKNITDQDGANNCKALCLEAWWL
ncbi:unnamed protein product [Trifolium pratense]|uniref:Uncharacterized protein n=1 Tax=Trifolium pratense TaxID=57577 RepID=A0ACB0IJE9_TRIPR|nr:unnamed protein product [Trifolium pratense]